MNNENRMISDQAFPIKKEGVETKISEQKYYAWTPKIGTSKGSLILVQYEAESILDKPLVVKQKTIDLNRYYVVRKIKKEEKASHVLFRVKWEKGCGLEPTGFSNMEKGLLMYQIGISDTDRGQFEIGIAVEIKEYCDILIKDANCNSSTQPNFTLRLWGSGKFEYVMVGLDVD